jgi:peptidoglycan/xylan/chitin deacetylase (PgdA/CDA1 family)
MSALIISLDFELFWGVADAQSLASYGRNIEGVWKAIPRMLSLFRRHRIEAIWATVGMLMCRDHAQWRSIRPSLMPGYANSRYSSYGLGAMAMEHPQMFFARPLVEEILATPGQEVASHTYSHFYCGEQGATPAQLAADLECAAALAAELGLRLDSLVFPRNQDIPSFLPELARAGIRTYRGNPDQALYRDGHMPRGGALGRAARLADSWLPLTGHHLCQPRQTNGLTDIPASMFLRPRPRYAGALEPLRLARLKRAMTAAAMQDSMFHLWWHPHNFGVDLDRNLAVLEQVLAHFSFLRDAYGMRSLSMRAAACASEEPAMAPGLAA